MRLRDAALTCTGQLKPNLEVFRYGLVQQRARGVAWRQDYFFVGGKSVQLPCATSAAMPMLSPSVG